MNQAHLVASNTMDPQGDSTSGSGHSMLPLPLNLIAMIITYVRDEVVSNETRYRENN